MASHPVESYLKDLDEICRTRGGVAEESYYGALANLLNEIGKKLKPARRCKVVFGSPRFWGCSWIGR
jgi:hypothetical protein